MELTTDRFSHVKPGTKGIVYWVHPDGTSIKVNTGKTYLVSPPTDFKHAGPVKNTAGSVINESSEKPLKEGQRVVVIGSSGQVHDGATGTVITSGTQHCEVKLDSPTMSNTPSPGNMWLIRNENLQPTDIPSPSYDYINPSHYKKGDMEVWQMMVKLYGVEAYILHCRMCAFKYRMRLGDKPGQSIEQDLKKAKWYEDMANNLTTNKDGILNQFDKP